VSRNGHGNGNGVVGNIAGLGSDVASLVELQAKLAALDMKESVERVVLPLVIAGAAAVLALGAVPVGLLGVAWLLAQSLGIQVGWAMLLTALLSAVVAGIVAFFSVPKLSRSFQPMRRSHEELTRNVAWLRTVLMHSGRPSR
jgi:uncharacterized membrane protein YqjE